MTVLSDMASEDQVCVPKSHAAMDDAVTLPADPK